MTDSAGRQYKYSYDSNKNLTTYIDPAGKSAVFGYDSSGNLNRITDPNGNVTAVAYDGYRRVLSIQRITNGTTTPPTGPATTFTYNVGNTVVTDANGHGTTYAYDAYGRTTQTTDPLGHSSQTTWNADSEVTQTVTPLGHPTTNTYDSNNNLTQTTDPVGATTSAQYTSPTTPYLPTTVTDAAGEPSTIQYNGQGLPTLIKDALNEQSSLGYNSNGTLSSQTDPNNNTVAYGYNGQGQLASVTPPAGTGLGTPSVTYNAYGLPATSVDGKGARTTYTYDQLGRTTATSTVSADGASTIAFGYSYDSDGNLLAMSDSSGATTYTYNALNQETSEHHPDGKTVSYTYDGVGNMLTMTDSGGTVKYTYDAMDRVKSVTDRQNKTTYFLYDADGNRTESDFPNGVAEQMVYDAAGQLTNISSFNSAHATLTSFGYVYTDSTGKEVGRVTLETASDGTTHTKAYDGAGRLIEERVTDANNTLLKDWKWRYDAAGNMIMLAGSYTQKTLTYNAANELTNAGPNTFTYDANGNELYNSGSGVTSTWDPVSRITTMTSANGTVIQYNYTDGSITEVRGPVAYEYGATGVSTITDASGNTTTITRLPDGTPISMTNSTGTYFYLDDGQGNVAGVTGSSGQLDNSYSYDPMGNVTSQIGSVANPYTYGYEQYDPQMGVYYSEDGSYYDPSASQGQTSGSGLFFSDMEGEDPALTGGDASGADESGPGGLEFPESQINKVVKSAERMDHGQMRAVRKLNSHFGRGQPEYQGLKPNAKTALGIIRYVMEDPANWYDEGHYFDVYGQNGQGVRLLPDAHGDFTIFETFISWTHYLNKP